MLKIISRNVDGIKVVFEFQTPEDFVDDMNTSDDCMGDNEILLVVLDGMVLYSSLGLKPKTYDDTLRTMDLYDWFKSQE